MERLERLCCGEHGGFYMPLLASWMVCTETITTVDGRIPNNHLAYMTPCKQWDIYLISTGAGFLPSTVGDGFRYVFYVCSIPEKIQFDEQIFCRNMLIPGDILESGWWVQIISGDYWLKNPGHFLPIGSIQMWVNIPYMDPMGIVMVSCFFVFTRKFGEDEGYLRVEENSF